MWKDLSLIIDKEEKEGVEEHGRIWSSMVIKANYSFDMSKENPVLTISEEMGFNIEKGTWVKYPELREDFQEVIDGTITQLEEEFDVSGIIWNKELVTTYQNFIDECNKRKDIVDIISKSSSFHEATIEGEQKESILIKDFKKFK